MKLEYQNKRGSNGMKLFPAEVECRLTIPAKEALVSAGASVTDAGQTDRGAPLYRVRLAADQPVPEGMVACRTIGNVDLCLRLEDEPEYPMEVDDYWGTLEFAPCPQCGRPLVWWEAGYVPGYRVCTGKARHHVLAR